MTSIIKKEHCKVEFFIRDVFVTSFEYNNFTQEINFIGVKTPITISIQDFKDATDEIDKFESFISSIFHPLITPKTPFKLDIEKFQKTKRISFSLSIDNKKISDFDFNIDKQEVIINNIDSSVLKWTDWIKTNQLRRQLLEEVKNY